MSCCHRLLNLPASILVTVMAVLVFSFGVAAQAPPPPPAGATAGQVFKNVMVLKDTPADQFIPAMQFMASSLGTTCDTCHMQGAPEKDDKDEKKAARKMMEMMFAINKMNFEGERNVTCYTCHVGSLRPGVTPPVAGDDAAAAHPERDKNAPAADAVFARYIQALGGEAAIRKTNSRVMHGQMEMANGIKTAMDVYAVAPNKRAAVVKFPDGESATVFDGERGFLTSRHGVRPVTGGELEAQQLDGDFYFSLRLKDIFPKTRVFGLEKVNGQPARLVVGVREGKPPVRLYFAEDSGLLVRMVRYVETPLGRNATQVDYADFRELNGAKVPFQWTIARPNGAFTVKLDKVEANAAVDEKRFVMPATPPGMGDGPPKHY